LTVKRIDKGIPFVFFLFYHCLLFIYSQELPQYDEFAFSFPIITRMDNRDTGFRQYISDVEGNRRRLAGVLRRPEETIEHLTIYQYTAREGEDIFSIAARCNIPYSALASLNRLGNPVSLEKGKLMLLPSCPGLFIPESSESEIEKLVAAARFPGNLSFELKINVAGKQEIYLFFPGADFTPTERAFFLNSGFKFPLKTFRLTSDYGVRKNPVTGNTVMHQGVDLAAPEGTEVYSTADGIVTEAGYDPVYGNYIIITHQNRLSSLYGHLHSSVAVLQSTVKSGTLIGTVGSTGQSTGPHLHFELRQDGKAINPSGRLRG
jgi:murein DD-endopeptidase MepM/ murein hydrolase activator NlpD